MRWIQIYNHLYYNGPFISLFSSYLRNIWRENKGQNTKTKGENLDPSKTNFLIDLENYGVTKKNYLHFLKC